MKIWSELPSAQSREVVADAATALWLIFWASIAWRLSVTASLKSIAVPVEMAEAADGCVLLTAIRE